MPRGGAEDYTPHGRGTTPPVATEEALNAPPDSARPGTGMVVAALPESSLTEDR